MYETLKFTYTILFKKAQEKRHMEEIVEDGRKVFNSTERNVTVWTRF
jgi:hypothetical protein